MSTWETRRRRYGKNGMTDAGTEAVREGQKKRLAEKRKRISRRANVTKRALTVRPSLPTINFADPNQGE